MLPALHDDVIVLTGYADQDMPAHLIRADGETAGRPGWRPMNPASVRDAFARWADEWETGGSVSELRSPGSV